MSQRLVLFTIRMEKFCCKSARQKPATTALGQQKLIFHSTCILARLSSTKLWVAVVVVVVLQV